MLNATALVAAPGAVTLKWVAAAGLTVTFPLEPVTDAEMVSAAVTDWMPPFSASPRTNRHRC